MEVITLATEPEEEKTYEVKDKRRVNPDGTLRETTETENAESSQQSSQTQQATEPTGTEESSTQAEQLTLPRVYDLIQFMVGMLAEQAWIRMGVRLAPGYKEPQTDLAQAKVAIDTIVFMVDKVAQYLEENDRRALRALVSDLQINFVKRTT